MPSDLLATDPEYRDSRYPATGDLVSFASGGHALLGTILVAPGTGPHPTALLLHGFPGAEQNADLAHALRRAGWNALVFHYRGAWGSGGSYAFGHSLADVHAALAYLRGEEARERHRVDGDHLVLIGHSLGGFLALSVAAADPAVRGAASLAGFNFGRFAAAIRDDPEAVEAVARAWQRNVPPLRGATGAGLVAEVLDRGDAWELTRLAPALAARPLLLVAATRDDTASAALHHEPLVVALRVAGAGRFRHRMLDTDHGFADRRVALARLLLAWLAEQRAG